MYGHYFRNLDAKNRVLIPSKLKKSLGDVLYATIGPDRVLELRDKNSFNIWKTKLLSTNSLNHDARKFARLLLGNTVELEVDKQGRISIPENFITLTTLTKEVVFVGIGNKVELWAKEAFNNFQQKFEGNETLDSLAKKLLKDGIEI